MQNSKNCQFYPKEFFRILAEIIQELRALAGKLVNVRSGLVNAVIKRFISHEPSERAFSGLGVSKDRVNPACGRVEFRYRGPRIFIELNVFQQLTGGSLARIQVR